MSDKKTVKEQIRELEEEFAESIKEAQSQPGLREMEIVYGRGSLYSQSSSSSGPTIEPEAQS